MSRVALRNLSVARGKSSKKSRGKQTPTGKFNQKGEQVVPPVALEHGWNQPGDLRGPALQRIQDRARRDVPRGAWIHH